MAIYDRNILIAREAMRVKRETGDIPSAVCIKGINYLVMDCLNKNAFIAIDNITV